MASKTVSAGRIAKMKSASNVARGQAVERVVAAMLRDNQFTVDTRPRVKYHRLDFFGLFDIVAITPDRNQIWYIQAKRNSIRTPTETRRAIRQFALPHTCAKFIIVYHDKFNVWTVDAWTRSEFFTSQYYHDVKCEFEILVETMFEIAY